MPCTLPERCLVSRTRLLPAILALLIVGPCQGQTLSQQLTRIIDQHRGEVSVSVQHLPSEETFQWQANKPMPTASLIKFPLLAAAYHAGEQGSVDLQAAIRLRDDDKVPGSGILTSHFSAGATLTLRDCLRLMMVYSDNTATNLVIDQVGLHATSELMESLGLKETKLHSQVYRGDTSIAPQRSRRYGLGSTTAAEMIRLLAMLYRHDLVSKSASKQMIADMLACESRDKLPRDLPATVRVAHKTGATSSVRCDAGLIFDPQSDAAIAICVLTRDNEDRRWTDDNQANLLCGRLAKACVEHYFVSNASPTNQSAELAMGADGDLVEALQRTLNLRISPSPDIAVDGDFGPATKGTVMAFQSQHQLPPTGIVDAATWQALGPLVEDDLPVAPPEEINAQAWLRQPADEEAGVPFVTCKAWAIADANSGRFLWGSNAQQPLPMASTTKIMTALVVLEDARDAPEKLQEKLTFSLRADQTKGSTAGVRTGESLTVEELLYGLLLPSGNDASVALAEYVSSRPDAPDPCDVPDSDSDPASASDPDSVSNDVSDAVEVFVGRMNQTAARLGLSATAFKNTHGLTEAGHHASAADLAQLAWRALQIPMFAKIVNTPQRGVRVAGPGGYQRHLKWRNTNRLLQREGYDGVKTGTTTAAGSCLVARGHRGDRSLIVVVLGSSSSDARYADTRNLFRWGFQQTLSAETFPTEIVPTDSEP